MTSRCRATATFCCALSTPAYMIDIRTTPEICSHVFSSCSFPDALHRVRWNSTSASSRTWSDSSSAAAIAASAFSSAFRALSFAGAGSSTMVRAASDSRAARTWNVIADLPCVQ